MRAVVTSTIMSLHRIVIIFHLLGAGTLIGLVVVTALLAFKKSFSLQTLAVLNQIKWLGPVVSGTMLLSGFYLYWEDRDELNDNPLFWVKIALYIIEGSLAGLVIDQRVGQLMSSTPAKKKQVAWLYGIHAAMIIAISVIGKIL